MPHKNKTKSNKPTKKARSGASRSKQTSHSKAVAKPRVHMSMCAEHYARSLVNPFTGPQPCVPCYPPTMSRKVRVFSKGRFFSSSATSATPGYAFVCVDPFQAAANDAICAISTTAMYPNSTIDCVTTDAGITGTTSNSDYASTDIGTASSKVQFRVVSAGLRVKYSGTVLNAGGDAIAFQEPTHDSLHGSSISDVESDDEAKKFSLRSDRWYTVLFRPVLNEEKNFQSKVIAGFQDLSPGATGMPNSFFMAIQLMTASDSQPLDYEFYVNLEYTGKKVRGATRSHSDPVGFDGITTAISNSKHRLPREGSQNADGPEKSFLEEVGDFILGGITWVGEAVGAGVNAFMKGAALATMVM